jgi:hypothetical protein
MTDVIDPVPSAFDKFVAALTTLYRRFSVQFDVAGTSLFSWLLMQSPEQQTEFLAHFGLKAWMIPPILFIGRSLFVATPQPKVLRDTAVKAEVRAEEKAEAKSPRSPALSRLASAPLRRRHSSRLCARSSRDST